MSVSATPVPDVLLLGPPKCGTSSLFDWLAAHPDVAPSRPKETFYLMDAASPLRRAVSWDADGDAGYTAFFGPEAATAARRLDATTHHLFQDSARRFAAAHPDCRVVCILRDPAARVRSSFEFSKHNLSVIRDGLGFSEYVRLVLDGHPLYPEHCLRPESAWVLERDIAYGEYARWLRLWRDAVGGKRMFVRTFEQLARDPRGLMRELCAFLQIGAEFYESYVFPRKNETVSIRSHALHRIARRVNRALADNAVKRAAKRAYFAVQSRKGRRPAQGADEQVVAELRRRYAEHNRELAREFGLDLSAWAP